MRDFPTDPMRQHNRLINALCEDWLAAGTVTRDTPGADRVVEIARQLMANAVPAPGHSSETEPKSSFRLGASRECPLSQENNREAAQPNKRAASNS